MIAPVIPQPDYDTLFRASDIIRPAAEAPRDGRPILARDAAGDIKLIRWRKFPDLEEDGEPYWALIRTDEEFDFIDWMPSPFTEDEFMRIIG